MPAPSLNLQIPSYLDAYLLDARVYLPASYTAPTTQHWHRKLAIIGHPYAPLGGSYDDHVVLEVVKTLLRAGWVVSTFNFRGAHGKGRTSWTGKLEVKDFVSVVVWCLAYVQLLPPPVILAPASSPRLSAPASPLRGFPEGKEVVVEKAEEQGEEEEMELLIGGYSYGSLIASLTPPVLDILKLLEAPPPCTPAFAKALLTAKESARKWLDTHSNTRTSYSGTFNRAAVHAAIQREENRKLECEQVHHGIDKKWKVTARYLLVSPLLPPISSLMMGFPGVKAWSLGRGSVDEGEKGIEAVDARVLAVYGDGDTFTGVRKYRKWREKMEGERWKGVEVGGAGHFWREEGVMGVLVGEVEEWVRG
jgi:alpha/beta superfamily hydrolase